MRKIPTLLLALAATSTVHADRDQFLKDHPTADDLRASEFFAKWPALAKVYNQRDLDPLLFPGGDACDNAQSATTGLFSESSMSPDGKQLAVITAVDLDAKVARKLGMDGGSGVTVVAILFDGPAGKLVAFELPGGGGCDRPDVGMTWSADGKAILVASKTSPAYAAILDVRVHGLRAEGQIVNPSFSPGLQHIAGLSNRNRYLSSTSKVVPGDELQIDDAVGWGSTEDGGAAVTSIAWTSDTRLTFCAGKPKLAVTRYQAELVAGAKPKITQLGPCPSPPVAPPTKAPVAKP